MTITYDAKLAARIIAMYADAGKLTEEECSARLPRISEDNRGPLCDFMPVLNTDCIVTKDEARALEEAGVPREFVREVAGQDGRRACEARQRFLDCMESQTELMAQDEEVCAWDGTQAVDTSEYVEMDGTYRRITGFEIYK
jgi:hypothetical protein